MTNNESNPSPGVGVERPKDDMLWCVQIDGPGDIVAVEDRASAIGMASRFNAWWVENYAAKGLHPYDPTMWASPQQWPYSAEAHAADLGRESMEYDRFRKPAERSLSPVGAGEATAWEGYWPGTGSIDSHTRLTRFKYVADHWRGEGAEVRPLVYADTAAPVPASPTSGEVEVPADVTALVVAARRVAFEDQSVEAIRALDAASEAFAARVPWEDEPAPDSVQRYSTPIHISIGMQPDADGDWVRVSELTRAALSRRSSVEGGVVADAATVRDYDEATASHLQHVLDLDIAMNGGGAAKRPLLIDIKDQLLECIKIAKAHPAPTSREAVLEEALREVIEANDANTGAEPSVSVLDRAVDEARALVVKP